LKELKGTFCGDRVVRKAWEKDVIGGGSNPLLRKKGAVRRTTRGRHLITKEKFIARGGNIC